MITLFGEQVYAAAAMIVLMILPGWGVGRLLDLQLSVPKIVLPAAWFTFGFATWSLVVITMLALGLTWRTAFVIFGVVTLALIIVAREKARRVGHPKPQGGDVSLWSVVGILGCVVLAGIFRTRMAFDTIFHLGIVRRIAELGSPTFSTVDRIFDSGVNPSYAIPSWQAAMAMVSGVTGLDPATVVEAMAVVAVLFAACAAGGLGRVVSGRVSGEIAGVAAYAWLRVFFPRRELEGDGIAYAAMPGNIALDTFLPLILLAMLVIAATGHHAPQRRKGVVALAVVASILLVVVHGNYVIYLALMGLGALAWAALSGVLSDKEVRRRVLISAGIIAGACAAALIFMIPVYMQLERFGNPINARIDYHLVGSGFWQIVRPGHLYDWFAAPGLIAMLLLPYAVFKAKGVARPVLAGSSLALLLTALLPPVLHVIGSAGSWTVALRMPRAMGVLLAAGMAIAIPELIDYIKETRVKIKTRSNNFTANLFILLPFLIVVLLSFAYGYPLGRNEPPQYGWNWPTLFTTTALLIALIIEIKNRKVYKLNELDFFSQSDTLKVNKDTWSTVSITGICVLLIGLTMLPSGIVSLRRGAWQSKQFVASYKADDLGCLSGIQKELRRSTAGSITLADPVTAYLVQGLSPTYILADYKIWNGRTDSSRSRDRIEMLRGIYSAKSVHEARVALSKAIEKYGAKYLVVSAGDVEPPLGSTMGAFDAIGLRQLLSQGIDIKVKDSSYRIKLISSGQGMTKNGATEQERKECDLSMYQTVKNSDISNKVDVVVM